MKIREEKVIKLTIEFEEEERDRIFGFLFRKGFGIRHSEKNKVIATRHALIKNYPWLKEELFNNSKYDYVSKD